MAELADEEPEQPGTLRGSSPQAGSRHSHCWSGYRHCHGGPAVALGGDLVAQRSLPSPPLPGGPLWGLGPGRLLSFSRRTR